MQAVIDVRDPEDKGTGMFRDAGNYSSKFTAAKISGFSLRNVNLRCIFADIPTIQSVTFILIYKSQQDTHLQSLFYLTTALHVSGVIITHLQEHKTTVTTASGNRHTVLLSAAIVEELELI